MRTEARREHTEHVLAQPRRHQIESTALEDQIAGISPRVAEFDPAELLAQVGRHQLEGVLAERERGSDFDPAWRRSCELALAEVPGRETWAEILRWSRPAFERAYNGAPRRPVDYLQPFDPEPRFTPAPRDRVDLVA
jgi:hypothetical protein